MFDNSAFPPVRKFSRALAIRLDEAREDGVADLGALTHPRKLLTATQGNQQTLPNGDFLVGWGSQRHLTEFDAAGNVLFNAALSLGFESYRAYRLPWVGLPRSRPKVAAADEPGAGTDAYIELERRDRGRDLGAVRRRRAPSTLQLGWSAPRRGFETKITVPGRAALRRRRARGTPPADVLSTRQLTRVTG